MKPRASQLRLVGTAAQEHAAAWLADVAGHLAPADRETLRRGVEFAAPLYGDRRVPSGEPLLEHALDTAESWASCASITKRWLPHGCFVARRRTGSVGKLREPSASPWPISPRCAAHGRNRGAFRPAAGALRPEEQAAQLEALRKMLLAMVQDVRVVLIKLADHMQELRYLGAAATDTGCATGTARLRATSSRRSPTGSACGSSSGRWRISRSASSSRRPTSASPACSTRSARIASATSRTSSRCCKGELTRAGIAAEVTGRPKHIYSIYKKMQRKGYDFEALYDMRAVRVLVDDVKDCYAALGLVHNLWSPIPKEFDDYIARPKSNHYRSLHTAVIGPEGKALEVQIRTHEMHQHSELGVAAHWRYKEGSRGASASYDEKIAWLRQMLEWKDEIGDAGELAEQFRTRAFRRHDLRAHAAGQGDRSAEGRDADRFRLPRAHRARPSLPRRESGRRDGAAQHAARQRPAGGDPGGEAGRAEPRLAQPGAGLRPKPRRARQGRQWFNRQNLERRWRRAARSSRRSCSGRA